MHDPNPGRSDWQAGVQQYNSFLVTPEKDKFWRYSFDTWDVKYDGLRTNVIAIAGGE